MSLRPVDQLASDEAHALAQLLADTGERRALVVVIVAEPDGSCVMTTCPSGGDHAPAQVDGFAKGLEQAAARLVAKLSEIQ